MPSSDRPKQGPLAGNSGSRMHLVRRAADHPWLVILIVLALATLGLALAWDWNWFKGPLERQVQARTGRQLQITGDLRVDLGRTIVVHAGGARFANAQWSKRPTMASVDGLEVHLELLPLLRGQLRIPHLRMTRPRLLLETAAEGGQGNWQLGDDDGGKPAQLRQVHVDGGLLRFLDAPQKTDILVGVASEAARGSASAAPIHLRGGGRWRGNDFTVQGRADSPLELQDTARPYRFNLHAESGTTRAHVRGALVDPLRLTDFDLRLALSGSDLEHLHPLLGMALPPTPPYSLDGELSRDGSTWRYDNFRGRVGDSDIAGVASVDTAGERPYLRAELTSTRLDLDDLSGFLGGAPQSGAGESTNPELAQQEARESARDRVIPDTPYDLTKLRSMDADVRLKAARVQAPGWPIDDMEAHLLLENGLLRLDPLNFGVAGGDLRATINMDARESPIRTRVDVTARGLNLARLLPGVKLARDAVGKVGGTASLAGSGNSIAAMLGSSNGELNVGMGRGRISNLLMEFAGLDLAEILKFKLTQDRQIPVRCAFGDFAVDDGVMTARSLAFDTTDTILIGSGSVSLRDETLDLLIRPRPKDRSLLSLRAPLTVDGTFKDPGFRPDFKRVGLRGALALALGSIAPPAALLATLELGPGEDAGCGGSYAK